ncbi:2-C-methyl-D-erythritol 4-phosphate cytidylyltransferase [Mycolicibacterium neoaurum]|uniref:IspD/TarI family cytidylyltransferase n=1 Tax=Mycolicibacterium neoaurum TaxID=1795 RepID=UPI00267130FF|nr:2-C-methyl-D-erythritol 4-phosphate cytidylyltransferase [Mycolicibacterium neoaurum]MDO3398930.1 2-C-methyl-D-erythritol 4-phosphate cytidylyltransferase [Mycolicibacterium neoaurum]
MELTAVIVFAPQENPGGALTPLCGDPAVRRMVRSLSRVARHVLVVVDEAFADRFDAALAGLPTEILPVDASATRADCLALAGVRAGRRGATHVLLADHRHPLMAADMIDRVVSALADGAELVVPVLPVTDTVKTVDAGGTITATVDRSTLRLLQYPRGMRADRLPVESLAGAVTVDGDADAVSVELPADAALLEAVIACRRAGALPAGCPAGR